MEPQMNADERGPVTPEGPPAQGEIRDLVQQLKEVIHAHWSEHQAELDAIALCNEILAVEADFSQRAQTLAGRCYEQAAELGRLRKIVWRAYGRIARAAAELGPEATEPATAPDANSAGGEPQIARTAWGPEAVSQMGADLTTEHTEVTEKEGSPRST